MGSCDKILDKARRSPHNLTFTEICKLADCYGWIERPGKGSSHVVFFNAKMGKTPGALMNFQNDRGKAKGYQVKQLLGAIESLEE
jgi:hypothetical protein